MGKVGRFACILTPMALSIASLICLLLVFLGDVNKNDSTLSDIYFMKANTSNFRSNFSSITADLPSSISSELTSALEASVDDDLKDWYTVGIWNYCSGSDNSTLPTYCSDRQASYYFNPISVWGLNGTLLDNEIPDSLSKGIKLYGKVAKWMFAAYSVAFWLTVAEIIVGVFAICSRWGSFVTTIVSVGSTLFTIAASATSAALYGTVVGTFDSALKPYDIDASLGGRMQAITWLASAFSLASGLFWFLSMCCCSGKSSSPRNYSPTARGAGASSGSGLAGMFGGKTRKTVQVEKTPYTYERVNEPYSHGAQSNDQVPLRQWPGTGAAGYEHQTGYEPFRHERV
ncbi:hypothetical protein K490DRAFT_47535 [Saccharata proteae CBS 121410]|uniref:Integral membrane protein n=1 Tax=Saccharata proteae CBS 121410 TaxID=1314787 RepID=A0A9P4HQP4_9PEZI|nr:hypothetical protein K490DRAFT_47535 [Saccharata proteae CBS 121410]